MASLNKLAIRGIRSFDDKQIAVIEFFSPVTVIVGHNGSGKTTIIECLKYATTGDQPPNTRGGAFVHDPKMANEKEVKAQVKLRFIAANGTRMLAVRNLSVTVKKAGGLTMKTLESILSLADPGSNKRGTISTKCAEIDTEIPHLLGVSKSVLENVIFCHQEDSYWPLSEPSALKKKFDDIFEATRYTKALDAIKSLRKERMADLKVDQERLENLRKEKTNADKLRDKITELSSYIGTKEVECNHVKIIWEELLASNTKFYEMSINFRNQYREVESLEKKKAELQEELTELRSSIQEESGTEQELNDRKDKFGDHIEKQVQRIKRLEADKDDMEEAVKQKRKEEMELNRQQAEQLSNQKVHEVAKQEREVFVRSLGLRFDIKGYDSTPLEQGMIAAFSKKLVDLEIKLRSDGERLQQESDADKLSHQLKIGRLIKDLEQYKARREHLHKQIADDQVSLRSSSDKLDEIAHIGRDLATLSGELIDKEEKGARIRSSLDAADFDAKLESKSRKIRDLEDAKDRLQLEFAKLSMQAESRAKLELLRAEVRTKTADIRNTLATASEKFRLHFERDIDSATFSPSIEAAIAEMEQSLAQQNDNVNRANNALQKAEVQLSSSKAGLKSQLDELKKCDEDLRVGLNDSPLAAPGLSLEAAITEATKEVNHGKMTEGQLQGGQSIYKYLLETGQAKKTCTVCNRTLDKQELVIFEKSLYAKMQQSSLETVEENRQETEGWEEELHRLQDLQPTASSIERLKGEIPLREQSINDQENAMSRLVADAESTAEALVAMKSNQRGLQNLHVHAVHVGRQEKDIARASHDIQLLEEELLHTGSTKTSDEVQIEIEDLAQQMRTCDREKQALLNDREQQNIALRKIENSIHEMKIRHINMQNLISEKETLEANILTKRREVTANNKMLRELDDKINEGQGPLEMQQSEHARKQGELQEQISMATSSVQALLQSIDSLDSKTKAIERYTREKHEKRIALITEQLIGCTAELERTTSRLEDLRKEISALSKEVNESGAALSRLRENIRLRKLVRQIANLNDEIASHDMEQAATARKNFDEQYNREKTRETEMQSRHARLEGEIKSKKEQMKENQNDLKEYKDVNKKYTEQLIKVKMSDMANSDLEKYGKALDNAIMKYHSLKMEEVNDTMRHLWNKTYQGTDIDGIKVRSDAEGGASKRSYNYRVVMTKDQVEMDMRGRCSAGQKMLASIIIRLALSDSFGQNCGILALDEPTNSLDTENIEALANSLVDIINERRGHSNFQLIIITHDEEFLRKLGQSDVMEYYWRVKRDERQRSMIQRERVR